MQILVLFILLFIVLVIATIPVVIIFYPKWKVKNSQTTTEQALKQLKQTYESGFITKEEYNQKKTEILKKL